MARPKFDWSREQKKKQVAVQAHEAYRSETLSPRASRTEFDRIAFLPRPAHFLRNVMRIRNRLKELSAMASMKGAFPIRKTAARVKDEVRRGMAEDKQAACERPHPQAERLIEKFYAAIWDEVRELESRGVLRRGPTTKKKSSARKGRKKRSPSRKR